MLEIPAITIWQPWASLLACGAKQYETRSWATKYRGRIAIHAGLQYDNCFMEGFAEVAHEALKRALPGFTYMYDLPRGNVIATAELVGCWPIEHERFGILPIVRRANSPHHTTPIYTDTPEYLFGDWTPGRYAWEFANMTMLPEPIPAKGKQGLWKWRMPA